MATEWNPNVPHCDEERRYISMAGKDGGGHTQCLAELNSDGSCPFARAHHKAWVASGLSQDNWAALVLAFWLADGTPELAGVW